MRGPARHLVRDEEQYRRSNHDEMEGEFTWPERIGIDIDTMARDAFARVDDIHDNILNEEGQGGHTRDDVHDKQELNDADMENLLRQSIEKIFEGSQVNRLQCELSFFSPSVAYTQYRIHLSMLC